MTTTVPTASLLPIITALQTQVIAPLQTLYNAASTSAPGTQITAPSTAMLNDAAGSTWSFGAANFDAWLVLRNGATVGNAQMMTIDTTGVVWVYYGGTNGVPHAGWSIEWYEWTESIENWTVRGTTGPVT